MANCPTNVRQIETTALEVNVLPSQMENFAQAAAGQHQKPDCSNDMRRKDFAAVLRAHGTMLGFLAIVESPRQALRLGKSQRFAQAPKLFIQSGITEVIYLSDKYEGNDIFKVSKMMLDKAGVK